MADSRIPMMGRPIQLNSPLNMLARVQGIDNMRQTNALNAMQMQDAQAQRAAQAQASQARQQALAQLPPPPPDAPPEWHQMHRAVVTGLASPKDYFDLVTKPKPDRKLTVVGNTAIDPNTGQPVYSAPERPEKAPEIVRLVEARDAMPPGDPRRAALDAYITKQTTHAPAASTVTYAAPVPILLPDGTTGYAQPGNRAGAQPMVMTGPDGKPLAKPREAAAGLPNESERTAGFLLQRIRDSQRQLSEAVKSEGGAAKPGLVQEAARLVSEPLANSITGDERQRVESAQLDILDAALTLGTGAAYTREQLQGYRKSYFPQIGDGAAAIKDKKARLQNLIRAAETKAGRAGGDTSNRNITVDW